MKKYIYLALAALTIPVIGHAQQSDYQTVIDFQAEIERFRHQIDNAITSKQLENLDIEINEFRAFYSESEVLINRALYPVRFDAEISSLQSSLITNENRLVMIEHQREQLFEMSNRITAQRSEISRLYSITDSLKTEIIASQASEARLSDMISDYRVQLEQRDRLVFEMVDSLLITHENVVFKNLVDGESKSYTIASSENPLSWIETMLEENTNFSRHQNRLLDVEDYIRMHSLQQHFDEVWAQVGDDFITVYGGNQKTAIAQSIEQSIEDWRLSSTERMWVAIDQYLDINEIDLIEFDNRDSFYASLDAFIQNGQMLSESEILTTNGYSEYQKIADFWSSTFKNEWNMLADEYHLLSSGEIAMIDVALTQWEETSRPIHPMLVAILSIMIVSLTGFILVMIRSKATR